LLQLDPVHAERLMAAKTIVTGYEKSSEFRTYEDEGTAAGGTLGRGAAKELHLMRATSRSMLLNDGGGGLADEPDFDGSAAGAGSASGGRRVRRAAANVSYAEDTLNDEQVRWR
jgi:hypothetical protein